MNKSANAFARLVEPDEQSQAWMRRRAEATCYIAALGDDAIFETLASTLELSFEEDKAFPDRDALVDLVKALLENLNVSKDGSATEVPSEQVTVVVSGALANFLCRSEPSVERLSTAAKVDSYLDLEFVAGLVSRSGAAKTWLEFLIKLKFDVNSINDDEYQASDELVRWRKELKEPIPSWHEGNFPSMGSSAELLVSALLRALDEDAWLRFLDRMPIPALVEWLLWYAHIDRSPGAILDWIRRAPAAFDEAGDRTDSALVFVLERRAFALIEAHIIGRTVLSEDADIASAIEETEFLRRELAEAIGARSDGKVLLAEFGARALTRAQSSEPESQRGRLVQDLHYALGLSYATRTGGLPELAELSRSRASHLPSRSVWGLWLLSSARAFQEFSKNEGEARAVLGSSWAWLVQLLVAKDAGHAELLAGTRKRGYTVKFTGEMRA